jgi:hypothetical protein
MSWICNLFSNCKSNDDSKENESNNKIKKINLDFYDEELKIERIEDIIQDGWEINIKNNYNNSNDFVKIGIIGETKKGKTYVLQKIINKVIDKKEIIPTKGLSIKYPKEDDIQNSRNFILLDTAGIEKPLLHNEKKILFQDKIELFKLEDLTKEKLLLELFVLHFIITYSEIPLLVVGELTFSEQKLFSKIQNILRNQKEQKKIFVIHNLQNYNNIQEVNEYIEKVLLKLKGVYLQKRDFIDTSINEENGQRNKIYYEQKFEDYQTYNIIHLIMANEFSEAGQYYNTFTIDFVKKNLNQFPNLTSFSLEEKIIENFIEFSKSILNEPIDKNKFEIKNELKKIVIKYNGEINYKNHLDYQLETFNLYNNNIVPQYSYYIFNDQFIVEIEVAGKTSDIKCIRELKNGNYYFKFSGKKIDNKKDNLEIKNYYTSQRNEVFELNLSISSDKIILTSDDYDLEDLRNGILAFKFSLYKKTKNKKIYE